MSNLQKKVPDFGFMRVDQVLDVYPVSKATWWAGVRSGKYPPGYKLGQKMTAWKAEHIRQLIESVDGGVKWS